MNNYSSIDFADWFKSIHGYTPYPWQTRLVDKILNGQQAESQKNAGWPDVLDLPTGSGKTTALDIAIYTQAADPNSAPRRVVYVVDRRAIVSQTTAHVRKLQESLLHPEGEVQQRITESLRSRMANRSPNRAPLHVAELRGGIPLDNEWASEPDIPTVLISTVDQVGSRLLFRGYGVSPKMRPIHAGLLGNDCLWLLDEVHLSKPFAQTLIQLKMMASDSIRGGVPIRNGVVQMSATPVDLSGEQELFKLNADDLLQSPKLQERVVAVKHGQLKELKKQGAKRPEDILIDRIPGEAKKLPGKVIGVIVNRVETAVKVARQLRDQEPDAKVIVLTGRMRPLEREEVWEEVDRHARAGRDRRQDQQRVYVVSTQTIEAGADLDFDAMVTEAASLDALVQRAGRVDRRGELSAAGSPAQVLIVAAKAQTNEKKPDPVYGETLAKTWNLLNNLHGKEPFDIGPASTQLGTKEERLACSTPHVKTTRLAHHHLDALSQTFPEPATQPEVAYHLHGVAESRAEVSVIWRGELPLMWASPAFETDRPSQHELTRLIEQLLLCPPRSSEAIALPLLAFNRWAQNQSACDRNDFNVQVPNEVGVADIERYVPEAGSEQTTSNEVFVLRWGAAESEWISVRDIRDGDTLVVPLAWGGLNEHNWDPESTERVRDLGDWAQFKRAQEHQGEAPCIRLSQWFGWPATTMAPAGSDSDTGAITKRDLRDTLPLIAAELEKALLFKDGLTADQEALLSAFKPNQLIVGERLAADCQVGVQDGRVSEGSYPNHRLPYYTVIGEPLDTSVGISRTLVFETDGSDETSSLVGKALTLDQHSNDVATMAEAYTKSLGMDAYAEALRLAGSFHDIGKVDPRFQVILHGGDQIAAAVADEPLAKSKESPQKGAHALAIIDRSGYPRGTRHELLSLALIESLPEGTIPEGELVKHLVATHHGMCRAIPPRQDDRKSIAVEIEREGYRMTASTDHGLDHIGSGIVDRFWAMTDRFGWYGLAWLEAILRLADHHESARRAAQGAKEA